MFGQSGACLGLHLLPWRVLQDEVVQHFDGGAHRPAPGGGVYAHIGAEHSGVSVRVGIACTSLNSMAGDLQ